MMGNQELAGVVGFLFIGRSLPPYFLPSSLASCSQSFETPMSSSSSVPLGSGGQPERPQRTRCTICTAEIPCVSFEPSPNDEVFVFSVGYL